MHSRILEVAAAALLAPVVFGQPVQARATSRQQQPVITVAGQSFATWQSYTSSALFQLGGLRCGSAPRDPQLFQTAMLAPSDCGYNSTTINSAYDPGVVYTIPVVVHVLERTNGQGHISAAIVQSQIDILNEDFRALPGSNGAPGVDGAIQFELASVDPSGAPTTGITYSVNNTWYNDGGSYWNSLSWDTNRYLNIYTNNAGGYLGYVPSLPQTGGIVGSNADRVVCLWSAFGQNGPIGAPFNLGRTVTHEVGHYLGLFHTFDGGCATSACYSSGDLICDTARESQPTSGCNPNKASCGSLDPIHNYMDYSDDACMNQFTNEQVNRMRCTLENWRPNLANVTQAPGTALCFGDGSAAACPCGNSSAAGEGCKNSTGKGATLGASGTNSVSSDNLALHVEQGTPNRPGVFFQGEGLTQTPFKDGLLCAAQPIIRLEVVSLSSSGTATSSVSIVTKGAVNSGMTRTYQFWYRDNGGPCATGSNLSAAYQLTWQ
jgi:Pregnancy-associated plasma protein-A